MELTRWLPAWKMRRPDCTASTMAKPSATVWTWFFAVDIFAGGDCVEGYAAMEMVAGGDDDGVDVFAIEERAVVAGGGNVGAVGFFGGGEAG